MREGCAVEFGIGLKQRENPEFLPAFLISQKSKIFASFPPGEAVWALPRQCNFEMGAEAMRILHLTETDYKVGLWSGGSTTELFIWPEGADYAKREFTLRVSSARVDLDESDFTPLAGVTRYITPLTGGFTLTHPGCDPVVMGPVDEPYRFSGEIRTHCVGKATDFNLMLKGAEGEMTLCEANWHLRPGFNCLYAVADTAVALESGYTLKVGELLVVFAEGTCDAKISAKAIACFAEV